MVRPVSKLIKANAGVIRTQTNHACCKHCLMLAGTRTPLPLLALIHSNHRIATSPSVASKTKTTTSTWNIVGTGPRHTQRSMSSSPSNDRE